MLSKKSERVYLKSAQKHPAAFRFCLEKSSVFFSNKIRFASPLLVTSIKPVFVLSASMAS